MWVQKHNMISLINIRLKFHSKPMRQKTKETMSGISGFFVYSTYIFTQSFSMEYHHIENATKKPHIFNLTHATISIIIVYFKI